jgi:hypothetical protein
MADQRQCENRAYGIQSLLQWDTQRFRSGGCRGKTAGVWMLYSGRIILLWLCKVFLGGSQNPVSGILLLKTGLEDGYAENQTAGNNK